MQDDDTNDIPTVEEMQRATAHKDNIDIQLDFQNYNEQKAKMLEQGQQVYPENKQEPDVNKNKTHAQIVKQRMHDYSEKQRGFKRTKAEAEPKKLTWAESLNFANRPQHQMS